MDLKQYIYDIPDYPKKGILFRDITPLLHDGAAFNETIKRICDFARSKGATLVAGPEARGFIFGTPVAYGLNVGFIPIRKPGKLPRKTISYEYALEYGTNTLVMHEDAIKPGDKVVIVDDLLATGGTVEAAIKLVHQLGGTVVGCAFVIELKDLKGRELLKGYDILSLIQY